MLTRIDVVSETPFIIPIVGATPRDSLLVRKISGLNPPEINLFIGDYSRDGGIYQGRRVGKRNVVMNFDLNPNPALGETVSGLREMLYKTFADPYAEADYLKLNLHDDSDRIRYIVGYTEKIDTEPFDVENTVQISLVCTDPYIRDAEETVLTNPAGWTSVPFTYRGTAETGFVAEIAVTATTPRLTLENNGKTMVLDRQFVEGDQVRINTNRGSRSLTLTPSSGPTISLIPYLTPQSVWLELHAQANTMKLYGNAPTSTPAGVRLLSFTQAYWGI